MMPRRSFVPLLCLALALALPTAASAQRRRLVAEAGSEQQQGQQRRELWDFWTLAASVSDKIGHSCMGPPKKRKECLERKAAARSDETSEYEVETQAAETSDVAYAVAEDGDTTTATTGGSIGQSNGAGAFNPWLFVAMFGAAVALVGIYMGQRKNTVAASGKGAVARRAERAKNKMSSGVEVRRGVKMTHSKDGDIEMRPGDVFV